MIGGRLRVAMLGGALLVSVLAMLIVSQVGGRPAVARAAASRTGVSVLHGSVRGDDARVAARLRVRAARKLSGQRDARRVRARTDTRNIG